ncbi:hypothetical protein ACFY7C_35820 [Streptomyces sp. NPDC012769]|uniref:hypothetical protein n=1 Tax=Streptomyces sp. NPDC012769 TaxID=3364848 RepID=UPI00367473E8
MSTPPPSTPPLPPPPPPPRLTARAARDAAQQRLFEMLQSQLGIARHQAEGWRNFLATATALLAAVLVLKGRENVAELPTGYRTAVVVMMACGLLALLFSAFTAASAAHGRPGDELKAADGEQLLAWESEESARVAVLVNRARWLAVAGVLATAAGVMTTWVAPSADKGGGASVSVHTRDGVVCGELVELDAEGITVKVKPAGGKDAKESKGEKDGKDGKDALRRLDWGTQAVSATPVDSCSKDG